MKIQKLSLHFLNLFKNIYLRAVISSPSGSTSALAFNTFTLSRAVVGTSLVVCFAEIFGGRAVQVTRVSIYLKKKKIRIFFKYIYIC
jgi:hypothetical protein